MDVSPDPSAGIVAGDVSSPGPWQEAAAGADLVIHAAALLSLRGDRARYNAVNVEGARRALDAAVAGGAKRFVHLSSVVAFGYDFRDGVRESDPVRTTGSVYTDTKIASENVVLQAHLAGEIPCTVIRPADVYGPGSRPWTVLPIQMIRARRMFLPARGRGIFSPVYVDNLVDGIVLAAAAEAGEGEIFTIGDGTGITTADFFNRYAAPLGRAPLPTLPNSVALPLAAAAALAEHVRRAGDETNPDSVRYLSRTGTYSIEKARTVLGYEPRVSLEEGIAACLRP